MLDRVVADDERKLRDDEVDTAAAAECDVAIGAVKCSNDDDDIDEQAGGGGGSDVGGSICM
jgi:hypothetical protein